MNLLQNLIRRCTSLFRMNRKVKQNVCCAFLQLLKDLKLVKCVSLTPISLQRPEPRSWEVQRCTWSREALSTWPAWWGTQGRGRTTFSGTTTTRSDTLTVLNPFKAFCDLKWIFFQSKDHLNKKNVSFFKQGNMGLNLTILYFKKDKQ